MVAHNPSDVANWQTADRIGAQEAQSTIQAHFVGANEE